MQGDSILNTEKLMAKNFYPLHPPPFQKKQKEKEFNVFCQLSITFETKN